MSNKAVNSAFRNTFNDNRSFAESKGGTGISRIQPAPGISPSLLCEIQIVLLPLGIVLAGLFSQILYATLVNSPLAPVSFYLAAGALAAIVMYALASQSSLRSAEILATGQARLQTIIIIVSVTFLLLLCAFYLLKVSDHFSRGWFALWYVTSVILSVAQHLGLLLWAGQLRAKNRLLQRVAVYGDAGLARHVLDSLFTKDRNLILAGLFSDEGSPRGGERVAGDMSDLISVAQSGGCDRVILALPSASTGRIIDAIASLEVLPIAVQLSPDALTLPCPVEGTGNSCGLVLLDVQNPPLTERGILIKTVMDYAIGTIALLILSPAMLAIAVAIKLDSRGSVFFMQSRHGYNNHVIHVLKFRTMTVTEDGPVVTQAVKGDKRVTRFGRFLRRTSLDELPQLFNVLRGELSLVGPRPHAVTHNQAYAQILKSYANRHKVKPGITGWAQIHGLRGETRTPEAMRQRVEHDLYYIKNWSPWLDLEILARTAFVPFFGAGAY